MQRVTKVTSIRTALTLKTFRATRLFPSLFPSCNFRCATSWQPVHAEATWWRWKMARLMATTLGGCSLKHLRCEECSKSSNVKQNGNTTWNVLSIHKTGNFLSASPSKATRHRRDLRTTAAITQPRLPRLCFQGQHEEASAAVSKSVGLSWLSAGMSPRSWNMHCHCTSRRNTSPVSAIVQSLTRCASILIGALDCFTKLYNSVRPSRPCTFRSNWHEAWPTAGALLRLGSWRFLATARKHLAVGLHAVIPVDTWQEG